MNPAPLSVLLLAWDDADPTPAVVGPALPASGPLLELLGGRTTLTVVLPQLSPRWQPAPAAAAEPAAAEDAIAAGEETATPAGPAPAPAAPAVDPTPPSVPETALANPAPAAPASTLPLRVAAGFTAATGAAPAPTPLPAAVPAKGDKLTAAGEEARGETAAAEAAPPAHPAPRLISLADLPLPPALPLMPQAGQEGGFQVIRTGWLAPAAPYLGSGEPPAQPSPTDVAGAMAEASDTFAAADAPAFPENDLSPSLVALEEDDVPTAPSPANEAGTEPLTQPEAARPAAILHLTHSVRLADLAFDPDPELPPRSPVPEDELSGEPGAGEAAALAEPEDDLTLAPEKAGLPPEPTPEPTPARAGRPAALASLRRPAEPAPDPADLAAARDDLHYRLIQYARFAALHLRGRADFAVIYAPAWPTWLAALELRQRSRRPLVLHLSALAADLAAPAERGWLLALERLTLRGADLVLVSTEALARRLSEVYELPLGPRLLVAPLPVGPASLQALLVFLRTAAGAP